MRDRIFTTAISVLFLYICLGLFYTQIIRYPYYSRLSKNNSIRIIPIDGPRGNIFDRNGNALVANRLSFDIVIIYRELRERTAIIHLLKDVLSMTGGDIAEALEKASPEEKKTILAALGNCSLTSAQHENVKQIIQSTGSLDYSKKLAKQLCSQAYTILQQGDFRKEGVDFILHIGECIVNRTS